MKIEDVLRRHEKQLIDIPGVTAVGIGEMNGKPVIVIMINQRTAELTKKLPSQLEGFGVKIEVSGEISSF